MAAPQDPNRIDVSLSILSDASLQAVTNLTNQMVGLRELIASQGMVDPTRAAQSAGQAAQYTTPAQVGTPGAVPNRPPIVQSGDPSNPSQGSQTSKQQRDAAKAEYQAYIETLKNNGVPETLSSQAEQLMMNNLSDLQRMKVAVQEKRAGMLSGRGSALDRFFQLYPGVSRDPYEDRTYEDVAQVPRMGESALPEGMAVRSGGISPSASFVGGPVPGSQGVLPGGGGWQYSPQGLVIPQGAGGGGRRPPNIPQAPSGPNDFGGNTDGGGPGQMQPGWAEALGREGITPESRLGLTIPRLGEFTIQDKLNMYAQWMGRAAMRRQDAGDQGVGTQFMGRTAAGAAYLRDQSAALVAVGREFQRLRNFARGEELSGEQLGFSRESALGDIEVLGAGFRLNAGITSEAQREALHQELTQRRVQAAPGVSGDEAQRIRQIVAGMGYSGDLNANLQMNLFRNLQQRGIAPEAVAPLVDQGVRQGNSSVAALRDIMYQLADAARTAHMTLEETTAATAEYAEGIQSIGGEYESALEKAAVFTRVGLDPRIMGQAQQSPMIQGILTARTGLPPQLQGVIGAPMVAEATAAAIEQGLALGSPFQNIPDRVMETASGERITVATGRDAQIAMAAQTTGLPRQIIERYMRNPEFLRSGAIASTMAGQLQEQIRGMRHRQREVPEEFGPRNEVVVPGPNGLERRTLTPRVKIGTRTESYETNLTDDQRQRLEHGRIGDQIVSYDELEAQMIAMDPNNKQWTDRVRKISKDHAGVEERIKVAGRIIGEATTTKPEPDYLVGLTDEARKYLKIETPKNRDAALPRANAGGAPANQGILGPNFPSSTGGAMTYGRPGP